MPLVEKLKELSNSQILFLAIDVHGKKELKLEDIQTERDNVEK